jgi:hypothetical protein
MTDVVLMGSSTISRWDKVHFRSSSVSKTVL